MGATLTKACGLCLATQTISERSCAGEAHVSHPHPHRPISPWPSRSCLSSTRPCPALPATRMMQSTALAAPPPPPLPFLDKIHRALKSFKSCHSAVAFSVGLLPFEVEASHFECFMYQFATLESCVLPCPPPTSNRRWGIYGVCASALTGPSLVLAAGSPLFLMFLILKVRILACWTLTP